MTNSLLSDRGQLQLLGDQPWRSPKRRHPMIEGVRSLVDPALWDGKIFSGGWRTAAGGTAGVTDKSTGESLGRTGVANAADIAAACKRAKAAFPAWAATVPEERAAILLRAADLLEAAKDE